jgi:hypothetical protein
MISMDYEASQSLAFRMCALAPHSMWLNVWLATVAHEQDAFRQKLTPGIIGKFAGNLVCPC